MENLNTSLGLVHGGELSDFTKSVALPLHLGNRTTSAGMVVDFLGLQDDQKQPIVVKNDEQANAVLSVFLQFLLDGQRYVDAAALLWSPTLFSGEPRSVKMIWDAVFTNVAVAVPGASSMGKSYDIGVFCYLDWRRDPYYTNIQIVGPTEDHLERNLFSHLAKLHLNASIPGPGQLGQLALTLDSVQRDSGIFGLVVPTGKKAAGRLQGVKVIPRAKPHPQFGKMSRLRVVLEEAELIPVGIWEDTINILSNARGVEQFKIMAPFNPKDRTCACAQRVEPKDGWDSVDIETSEQWLSKRGWWVVRLDAYKSENVIAGYEIFAGLQTKESMDTAIRNAGGVGTAGYYTFARGWYPTQGLDLVIIPPHIMADAYGTFEFIEAPQPAGGVDVALEGGDNAIFAFGRIGKAIGWRKPPMEGKQQPLLTFKNQFGHPVSREVLQLDQLFTMPKGNTVMMAEEIKRICKGGYIRGGALGVDRAGNGAGVHDILVSQGFPNAFGFNGSMSPTERKILEEDQQLPADEYANLLTEAWFSTGKLIEFGFLKISPAIPNDPLVGELTGRQYPHAGKKKKAESKKDYKSRGHKSPDRADAVTILAMTARRLFTDIPAIGGKISAGAEDEPYEPRIGLTDRRDVL
jgi:hypothetical protein